MIDLSDYPETPGVYLMYDASKKVLYVGKAKNIKIRLKQYFSGQDERNMIPFLVSQIERIETVVVSSEKEALLLESRLIKKFQPKYNVLLKDDKSEILFALNKSKTFPKIDLVRRHDKKKGQLAEKNTLFFGPFPYAYAARKMLDLLHQLFPLRQCSDAELKKRARPCILFDIKQCIAPCVGKCSKKEYDHVVDEATLFLKGKVDSVLERLYEKMDFLSENLEFERAKEVFHTIQSIEKMAEKRRGELFPETKCAVLSVYRREDRAVISALFFDKGDLESIEHDLVKNLWEEDFSILSSYVLQNPFEENKIPKEVYLNGGSSSEILALKEAYFEEYQKKISFLNPEKGEKKELVTFSLNNGEAFLKRQKQDTQTLIKILDEFQQKLALKNFPEKIECIDQSHFSGGEMVSSLVVFKEGVKDSSSYRKYRIKEAKGGDDVGALAEVLKRRFSKEEENFPDLLIVDGGKGQLFAALEVLKSLNIIHVDVIAFAKEKGRHDKGMTKETIYSLGCMEGYTLEPHAPLLHLLQKIRDEAHRFALAYQKNLRKKQQKLSILDQMPGIGPKKKKALMLSFGSPERILKASAEDLSKVKGINKKDIETIQSFLA